MTATHGLDSISSNSQLLYVALELSEGQWKLASSNARGQQARLLSMPARNLTRLLSEIARAKARFGLPPGATVHSCYEAGRDGFWLHRFLHHHGVNNVIVDSSSTEVNRRLRRAKADSLDAVSLVGLLMRFHGGETKVWHTVTVPHPDEEDQRHLHLLQLPAPGGPRHLGRAAEVSQRPVARGWRLQRAIALRSPINSSRPVRTSIVPRPRGPSTSLTITRQRARRPRGIVGRRALGIRHRADIPPLALRAEPCTGLRVRFHHAPLAVETVLPGTFRP